MMDPYSYWARVFAAWQTNVTTGTRLVETATASHDVVASRTETIRDAACSPFTADYAELALMVPEKVAAFSAAGNAIARGCWSMQADYVAQAQRMSAMFWRGRPPSLHELGELSSDTGMLALRTLEKGSRLGRDALAPVHKAAGANARRLGKRAGRG